MSSRSCSRNDVVLLPIPFSDLTSQKVRPAVVIGWNHRESASETLDLLSGQFQATPAVPARETGERTPRAGNFVAGSPVGQVRQPVEVFYGRANSQILVGENIQTSQRKDEKHLRSPDADASYLNQLVDDCFVREAGEFLEPDLSGGDFAGEVAQVRGLLRGEAGLPHLLRTQADQVFSGDSLGSEQPL